MQKIRIYELAKELGVTNKSILSELSKLGIEGKTHSSSIEPELAKKRIFFFKSPPDHLRPLLRKNPQRPRLPQLKKHREKRESKKLFPGE